MPAPDEEQWVSAGSSTITPQYRTPLPAAVVASGVVTPGSRLYWSVVKATGRVLLTIKPVDLGGITTVDETYCAHEQDGYKTIIPIQLTDHERSDSITILGDPLPNHSPFEEGDILHFVHPPTATDETPRYCLVLPTDQFRDGFEGALSVDLPD